MLKLFGDWGSGWHGGGEKGVGEEVLEHLAFDVEIRI